MREYLLRMMLARPFDPFTVMLHGGHVVDVMHPDFLVVDPGVLFATAYTPAGHRMYFDVEQIVAIRTVHAVDS